MNESVLVVVFIALVNWSLQSSFCLACPPFELVRLYFTLFFIYHFKVFIFSWESIYHASQITADSLVVLYFLYSLLHFMLLHLNIFLLPCLFFSLHNWPTFIVSFKHMLTPQLYDILCLLDYSSGTLNKSLSNNNPFRISLVLIYFI